MVPVFSVGAASDFFGSSRFSSFNFPFSVKIPSFVRFAVSLPLKTAVTDSGGSSFWYSIADSAGCASSGADCCEFSSGV